MRQRRRWLRLSTFCVLLAVYSPNGASRANELLLAEIAANPPVKRTPYTPEDLENIVPRWPNPFLSFLPIEAEPDYEYWHAKMALESEIRGVRQAAASPITALVSQTESEPNDTQASANLVIGFGTGTGEDSAADLTGSISTAFAVIGPFPEDDGSIPLANPTGLAPGQRIRATGIVGDGPFGSAGTRSGDFDFFLISGVSAGDSIEVDVDTPSPFGALDPYIVLYDSAGLVVASNDDDGSTFDSFLSIVAPAAGNYYLSIGGFGSFSLSDPFDSSSGFGLGSEGSYEVAIALSAPSDIDFFAVELEPGDILSATISGGASKVTLLAPDMLTRIGSSQNVSFTHPAASPLSVPGNATLSYVIETAGTWGVSVSGGAHGYNLALRAYTNPLRDADVGSVQTVFLDFDGAAIDVAAFGGFGTRTLSPLSAFLSNWGLASSDEGAAIGAIVAAVEESLSEDVRIFGNNGDLDTTGMPGDFDVEILNSRDHPDPGNGPNVTRIVIGGTISELGISTIGIAESIDVGNFETEEIAVVLLDLLSGSDGNSLLSFPIAPGSDVIDVIGIGVGNIAAHEAGHILGNFHTEQFFTAPNIMDQGGNLGGTVGVGPDGQFGTADDIDVDFGPDTFVPNEGFDGIEDTLNSIAFGLPTPDDSILVEIDIRPGSDTNRIEFEDDGVLPIVIFGSEVFDVRGADLETLRAGLAGAVRIHAEAHYIDINDDEFEDLLVHFTVQDLGLARDQIELCIFGETFHAIQFAGCDTVSIPQSRCDPQQGSASSLGPVNGSFETGDFTGWDQLNSGSGGIAIDDGTLTPSGPGTPIFPFEGSYAAATFQGGPGVHTLYTDVTLPPALVNASLNWADNLQNFAGTFADPGQEWRVEIWDPLNNNVLGELFSTEPGDAPIQDWTERSADLSPWIGQNIRLAFTQQDSLFFFNARLDFVRVSGLASVATEIDIRPWDPANPIHPLEDGALPVALLGNESFNVYEVNPTTLSFGPNDASAIHPLCDTGSFHEHVRDVNDDGLNDLVLHFRNLETGIAFGDTEACLDGETARGVTFDSCDEIRTIACGLGFELVLILPPLIWLRSRRRGGDRLF